MKIKQIILFAFVLVAVSGCKKEYITNEYITNEYVTNENIYKSDSYYQFIDKQDVIDINDIILPPYLKAGDSVAIIATSNKVTKSDMADCIDKLESWGLKVREASNLYASDGRYAGTVEQRIDGLQAMIDNPNMKALIAARGGYGGAQIVDKIDFTPLKENPKWLVGYSDVTVMHSAINNLGIATIHGAMGTTISTNETTDATLKDALFGTHQKVSIPTNSNCIKGKSEGRLVGGNLSIIYSLAGTVADLNMKDCILFFEDTGEANYAIDRMLNNLRLSGKLSQIKGVIVGQMSKTTQGSDLPINEIILNIFSDLNIPVMYGLNSGHDQPNIALYLGRNVELDVNDTSATITFK